MKNMIYLIKNRNYLKIGYSNNIEERLKNYNIHNPNYELLAIRDGTREFETFLHNRFKNLQVKGEWFLYSEDIVNDFLNYTDSNFNFAVAHSQSHIKIYDSGFKMLKKLKSNTAYNILIYLHSISEYNEGIVYFNNVERKRLMSLLGVKSNAITNALRLLEQSKFLLRTPEYILLNPLPVWKGDAKTRDKILKETKTTFYINNEL